MEAEPLAVASRDDVDGTHIIDVTGELDVATGPQLAAVLDECDDRTTVVVDLAHVTFLDSSGLAVLIKAHKQAVKREASFTVQNPQPNVRKVFEITRLDHLIRVDGTSGTALMAKMRTQ